MKCGKCGRACEAGRDRCVICRAVAAAQLERNKLRAFLCESLRVTVERDRSYNEMGGHDSLHDVRVILELRQEDGQWEAIGAAAK